MIVGSCEFESHLGHKDGGLAYIAKPPFLFLKNGHADFHLNLYVKT